MSADNEAECCCCWFCAIVCPCCCNNTKKAAEIEMGPVGISNNQPGRSSGGAGGGRSRPTPPPPVAEKYKQSRSIVRALYDFSPRQADEVAFKRGDRMEVLNNTDNTDWWMVKHLESKSTGYAPSNYVVIDDNRPESQDWWFAVDRREADKQLLLPGNPRGTFLIRNSADHRSYALSVRNFDEVTRAVTIKHYKIQKTPDDQVYIAPRVTFPDLLALVDHYRRSSDGLCCTLTKSCPQEPQPVPFKDCEIERRDIELFKKLGQGQFGEVWQGKLCRTVDVAVKTLKQGTMTAEEFLNEAKAMHRLRHRKLVLLMGVCTASEPYYIITELMVNGSLLDYLKKETVQPHITYGVIIDLAAQIADGLAYLEKEKYIHRDVRAANILVGENNIVKVADFGLARLVGPKDNAAADEDEIYQCSDQAKFPIKWTAPEAAFHRMFSTKSDVWSFGILLYEMITFGRVPYPGMSNQETLQFLQENKRMAKPTGCQLECPNKLYDIMLKCWSKRPEERPTFDYLYHIFDNYNTATEAQYDEM